MVFLIYALEDKITRTEIKENSFFNFQFLLHIHIKLSSVAIYIVLFSLIYLKFVNLFKN